MLSPTFNHPIQLCPILNSRYQKNYGHAYNVEVITEIIVRLQKKDKSKQRLKPKNSAVAQQSTDHRNARNSNDICSSNHSSNMSIAPLQCKRRDIVMYQGQQVEVMRVQNNNVEISYPISQNRLQRSRKTVGIIELQVFDIFP